MSRRCASTRRTCPSSPSSSCSALPANTACASAAFPTTAWRRLKRIDWPGNVRELQNVIERAVILCGDGGMLEAETSGSSRRAPRSAAASVTADQRRRQPPRRPRPPRPRPEPVFARGNRKTPHPRALEKTGQNRTHAAQIAGISVRTLRNKLNEYGVTAKDEAAAEPEEPETAVN